MKKLVSAILILFFITPLLAKAANTTVVYFFYSKTCPHCAAEEPLLDQLEAKYSDLEVKRYEISEENNAELFRKMAEAYGTSAQGVPMTFIGDTYVVGYGTYETSGKLIEEAIVNCLDNGCIDPIEKISNDSNDSSGLILAVLAATVIILGLAVARLKRII